MAIITRSMIASQRIQYVILNVNACATQNEFRIFLGNIDSKCFTPNKSQFKMDMILIDFKTILISS